MDERFLRKPSSRTRKKLRECSSFLTGRTFASRTEFGQFARTTANLVCGQKSFARPALEIIRRVRRTLILIGWKMRALLGMRYIDSWFVEDSGKWMTVSIFHSDMKKWAYLLTCGRRSVEWPWKITPFPSHAHSACQIRL